MSDLVIEVKEVEVEEDQNLEQLFGQVVTVEETPLPQQAEVEEGA